MLPNRYHTRFRPFQFAKSPWTWVHSNRKSQAWRASRRARVIAGTPPDAIGLPRTAGTGDMVRVSIDGQPLTATAALVWNGDLPRPLQQILFDTTDDLTQPAPLPRAG